MHVEADYRGTRIHLQIIRSLILLRTSTFLFASSPPPNHMYNLSTLGVLSFGSGNGSDLELWLELATLLQLDNRKVKHRMLTDQTAPAAELYLET